MVNYGKLTKTMVKLWEIWEHHHVFFMILMGKSTISMAMFNRHVKLPEGNNRRDVTKIQSRGNQKVFKVNKQEWAWPFNMKNLEHLTRGCHDFLGLEIIPCRGKRQLLDIEAGWWLHISSRTFKLGLSNALFNLGVEEEHIA